MAGAVIQLCRVITVSARMRLYDRTYGHVPSFIRVCLRRVCPALLTSGSRRVIKITTYAYRKSYAAILWAIKTQLTLV